VSPKRQRRRRDGIWFRRWDRGWYTTESGRSQLLRDAAGQPIRGRHREAEAKEAFYRLRISLSPAQASNSPLFATLAADYLEHSQGRVSSDTQQATKRLLEDFCTFAGASLPAAAVSPAIVSRWLDSKPGWNTNSRRRAYERIYTTLNHGKRFLQVLETNPLKGSSWPAYTPRTEVFTPDEAQLVLNGAYPALQDLCRFLYETGCRPGEAAKLEARHFQADGSRGQFILPPTEHKTGRRTGQSRHIFLSDVALALITPLRDKYTTGRLFLTTRRRPWRISHASEMFARLREKLSLSPKLTLYSFRHTFATRKIDEGVPIERVATWLGDSVSTVRRIYWHAVHRANKHLYDGLD